MSTDDFVPLIRRARDGDKDAAGALLERYLPDLLRYVTRQVGAPVNRKESSSDLVQSTCREVLADLPNWEALDETEPAFRAWLYRTAIRKILDRRKYYTRKKRCAAREVEVSNMDAQLTALGGRGNTPSENAMAGEEQDRLRSALASLPDDYQEVLRLAYFERLSHGEIGRSLGKTEKAVNSLVGRALARLATIMRSS